MNTKSDGRSQGDKFKALARHLGADESDDALDRAFGRLDLRKKPPATKEQKEPKNEPEN